MPKIIGISNVENLTDILSAGRTNLFVRQNAKDMPSYVHKWTAELRRYELDDLLIPNQIFVNGQWPPGGKIAIGVGGTRSPTVETFCLVSDVIRNVAAQGLSIVSGGVPGVDIAAHLAAIDGGGTTYAVLANPAQFGLSGHEWHDKTLTENIMRNGGFLSEYDNFEAFGTDVYKERLLQRDRIISGVTDLFIVFECNVHSATIDTAYRALAQGKKVVCVRPRNRGIRQGAEALGRDRRVISVNGDLDPEEIAKIILSEIF